MELIGPERLKDLAIAVRQKYQPDPTNTKEPYQPDKYNIEFYYITRGYEGHDTPEVPIVSRIEYVQREPEFVEIEHESSPGGTKWVQKLNEPTERRIKEGPTGESWDTLIARLTSDPSKEVSVIHDAHPIIWGGMKEIPESLAKTFTPAGYSVEPSGVTRTKPIIPTKDVQFPSRPQNVLIPTTRGRYVSGSGPMEAILGPLRPKTTSTQLVTPDRVREIISGLNEQDMRNVFAPGKTSDEIKNYLIDKMPEQERDATTAANLIIAMRGTNRRLWNMMELRNMRAVRGDLLQRRGVDIGDTDTLTQLQLDEVRRREILKHADTFMQSGGSIEGELIRRSVGGM